MKSFYAQLCRRYGQVLLLLGLIHLALDPSLEGAESILLTLASAWITAKILFRPNVFPFYPLTSMQILLFSASTQGLPLVGTLLDGHAITFSLKNPVETFFYIFLTQLTLLLAHYLYRCIPACHAVRREIAQRINTPLGLFRQPTIIQLWVMGAMGIVASVLAGGAEGAGVGLLGKIFVGFAPLAYAPFLIPVYNYIFPQKAQVGGNQKLLIGVYFLFVLVLSMAVNSRGGFASAIAMVGFGVILAFLSGMVPMKILRPRLFVGVGVLLILVFGPLSYMASVMQAAREFRGHSSMGEMISRTVEMAFAPGKVRAKIDYFERETARLNKWDERYVSNPILSRFIQVKYHNLHLQLLRQFGPKQRDMVTDMTIQKLFATLPDPLLRFVPYPVNKKIANLFSMGDFMLYAVREEGLGGRRVGSLIAHGLGIAGWGFFPLLIVTSICCFVVTDSLAMRVLFGGETVTRIAPVAVLSIVTIGMFYASADAVNNLWEFLIRGFWQMILLYAISFHVSRIFAWGPAMPGAQVARRPVSRIGVG